MYTIVHVHILLSYSNLTFVSYPGLKFVVALFTAFFLLCSPQTPASLLRMSPVFWRL